MQPRLFLISFTLKTISAFSKHRASDLGPLEVSPLPYSVPNVLLGGYFVLGYSAASSAYSVSPPSDCALQFF